MKSVLISFIFFAPFLANAQVVSTSPAFPKADEPVTITIDVSGTSLDHYAWNNSTNPVWIWAWIPEGCSSGCDAVTNVNPATSAQDAAKCIRISTNPDTYQITFTPTTFFNKAASALTKIGLKLKSKDWSENKQTDTDRFITFSDGGLQVSFSSPTQSPLIKNQGEHISITANASASATLTLKIDGATVKTLSDATTITYDETITQAPGTSVVVEITAFDGTTTKNSAFTYTVRLASVEEARPDGIVDGINYNDDGTKVTLSLWAPAKSSVYVLGDFNNWEALASYHMKQDGEHFWLEITGLTPNTEYAYQYYVDESLFVADPYADKILDPDDQYIADTTYPGLKAYPEKAKHNEGYFNRVSVLQTAQQSYAWQVNAFQRPVKENIVIYELLIRDFFDDSHRNYQALIDTISYFKNLGVNAIELMPVTEFNGNDSWGYNPTFMFAPDKYYGTKNKLKEFVDRCHQNGIAVILDIVMNQQDLPNPYALMYYDFDQNKIAADNPWFNRDATHPYNVFFDLNHESKYTQAYLDTVNHYWLNEYKIDGLRFDLSKGFTQQVNTDVSKWSAYDASRIAILKRMADKIWLHNPEAYVILEHFADNAEDKELAEYRADEGKGMMPWENMNYAYSQLTKGYTEGADITGIDHTSRGWNIPHAVGYMESHDEERLMYRNITSGNSATGYNTRSINTALTRMKGAALLFYTVPGPKMLWEFGELGYDVSINACSDGSISDACRTTAKPAKWEYYSATPRKELYNHIADLLMLRNTYSVFTEGTATFLGNNSLVKQIALKNNPYTNTPADASQMNVQIAVNEDIISKGVTITFPHTGKWYDYYKNGSEINVTIPSLSITLAAGEYKLYTDVAIKTPETITAVDSEVKHAIHCYPNPATDFIQIESDLGTIEDFTLKTIAGTPVNIIAFEDNKWAINTLAAGLYIAEVRSGGTWHRIKIIKK